MGDLAQKLGAYTRFHSSVPKKLNEFAIIITRAILEFAIRMAGAPEERGGRGLERGNY